MATRKRRRPLMFSLLLLVLISLCCVGVALTVLSGDGTSSTPVPSPVPATQNVETAEGYTFAVPGSAFVDGRSLEEQPPLTIMSINIWGEVPRLKAVCDLQHGTEVQLLEAQYYEPEERYYFLLKSGSCKGWLSENFLSPEKQEPIGDQL